MTHLFDGTPDPLAWEHATQIAEKYTNVIPVLLQWREGNVPLRYWIQEMRQAGYARTTKNWLLFIDSDEELRTPDKFLQWFLESKVEGAYKLSNYWYFLSKRRRSVITEDSIVLIHRKWMHARVFRSYDLEREYVYSAAPLHLQHREISKSDPFFDHFSWVRSKDVLLKKASTWTHRNDKPWKALIEKAFSENLLETPDFVHSYKYVILDHEQLE